MHARTYQTLSYKLAAAASHIGNPSAWFYYADRLSRRVTRRKIRFFSGNEADAVYGAHARDLDAALQAVGLPGDVHDPRVLHAAQFERGKRQIEQLDIPFGEMGLAGSSDLRLVYSAAIATGARDILETGVALGWSSLAFLNAVEHTRGRLISVDLPYPFLIGRSWVGAAVPEDLHRRWTLLRHADRIGIPKALRLSDGFDLIHYDSDKSPEGRLWAYPRLWRALRPGGLLLSDDVGDNGIWADFCKRIDEPLIVVRRQRAYAGIVRKPLDAALTRISA